MRILKVISLIWVCFDFTIFIGLETYPINYNDYPFLTTGFWGTVQVSGCIFGFSLMFFYEGFSNMYDILLQIYIRRQNFNPFLYILRTYFYYALPVGLTTMFAVFLMPYLGSGPIYSTVFNNFFQRPCSGYWWTNILLINNYYPHQ